MPNNQHALGAIRNPEDNRDIRLARVQSPVALPKKYKTDIDALKNRDQKSRGSCVGQAGAGMIDFFELLETGEDSQASARGLYGLCKHRDGYKGEGTYPRILAKVITEIGCPTTKTVPDDSTLSAADFVNFEETEEVLRDAYPFRVDTNYAWVDPDVESIKQAIFQNKVILASITVGKASDAGHMTPEPPRGLHYILLYGFEDRSGGKTRIFFRNSWGKKWGDDGDGYFEFPAMQGKIFDILAMVDIPNEILEEAREKNFVFTQTLKKGDNSNEVRELQKRLAKETAFDGLPCFRWPNATEPQFTTFFGVETEAAVKRYQKTQGIISTGTPETTGYGQLGPRTRTSLNGGEVKEVGLYPEVQEKANMLISIMEAIGHPIKVTEGYRSPEKQNELYAQGRTKPGQIVTNAKGGESFHNWRCAFDVAFVQGNAITYDGPWDMFGKIVRALGCEWGGDWSSFQDRPHVQYTGGYSLQDFQEGKVDKLRLSSATIEGNLFEDSEFEDIFGGDSYQVSKQPMLKRFKSLMISAASVLVTALAAVVITPEWATFIGDFYIWLGSAGIPGSLVVVAGLIVAEIWKAVLNANKVAQFRGDYGVAAAEYQENLDLY